MQGMTNPEKILFSIKSFYNPLLLRTFTHRNNKYHEKRLYINACIGWLVKCLQKPTARYTT